jgi:hypothetical protein
MDAYLVTDRYEGTLGTCKENRHPKLVENSTVYFILKIITAGYLINNRHEVDSEHL